jgi:hypothetical protein
MILTMVVVVVVVVVMMMMMSAQIQGANSPGRPNFAKWRRIYM